MSFIEQEASILHHIEIAPGIDRIRALAPTCEGYARGTAESIVSAVARFAYEKVQPLNAVGDRLGVELVDARVRMPDVFRTAMAHFVEDGWPGLSARAEWGGFDLPLALQAGCQELIDRACPAFGMVPGLLRSGARLLEAYGSSEIKNEWLPRLAAGEWTITICISESDAGSDVGRISTAATQDVDGIWRVTGEKTWISYGDHDLSERIGHCMLARTVQGSTGVQGLSLFLVPDSYPDAQGHMQRNGVFVRRVEAKLGLHASPTCGLGFEGAQAHLIGNEGRGLQALFAMLGSLRLSVAVQGLGIASGSLAAAMRYAADRKQGGPIDHPAVPLECHADVQRMLMEMTARVEVTRGLVMALATALELQDLETNSELRGNLVDFCAFLMPIAKTWGADTAFEVSHIAIQVFGGAGYTREWPVEQALRDARVFSIYEGASGIQALDLVHRRLWRDERRGLAYFLASARADVAEFEALNGVAAHRTAQVLDLLDDCSQKLTPDEIKLAESGASSFLQVAALAVTSWVALRCIAKRDDSPAARKAAAAGRYWLQVAPARARCLYDETLLGAQKLDEYAEIREAFR